MQEVLQSAAEAMNQVFREAPGVTPLVDFDTARDNIIMTFVNIEQNN